MASRWERVRGLAARWKADRAAHGPRHATVLRARELLDLGPVTTGRVDEMSDQIEVLRERAEHLDRFAHDVAGSADAAAREATQARDASQVVIASEHERLLFEQVWATTQWIQALPVDDSTLITVVLPTRGTREGRLLRAVASVVGQRHQRWQLVVVVDGDEHALAAVMEVLPEDSRIEIVASSGSGVSAARNTGLDAARGDLVAYLDDDNVMGPSWLEAVAWAGRTYPDSDLFYGAELVDDPTERGHTGTLPALHLVRFDRQRLARGNYIDQDALAHRRTLPQAHYDESLVANVDWDFLLRITAECEPVMIPVVASLYSTDAPDRLTGSAEAEESWAVVHARARDRAPLRVLALNQMYPLITETYIGEDLDALAAHGAEIACCVTGARTAPSPSPYPLYRDLETAVAEHEPDVLLLHWAPFAMQEQPRLAELGIPYAVRSHSFAGEEQRVAALAEDPLCVGVWAFPRHAIDHPKVHPLPIIFGGADLIPPPGEREIVLSVSAGLPKKDFPLLVGAFAALPGIDRRIVVGTTMHNESVVTDLVLACRELDDPPLVQANLDRTTVFGLLARASTLVYTVTPESGFGCPMSVVEAMTAGASVVLPDRPEAREVFGPDIRTYRDADDIVGHVRAVHAGGPLVDDERRRLTSWALEHFCDPETGKRFYDELANAVRG